jgi:catechol 2,3-dioxygenase-like lactoylglutathione lyase family enzyme
VPFRNAVPVLSCKDVDAALVYFTDVLGFVVDFRWGTPTRYAAVERDDAEIHLRADDGIASSGRVAMVMDGVEGYYHDLVARGADVTTPVADRAYGMRDFAVRTPDGHLLTFGQSIVN